MTNIFDRNALNLLASLERFLQLEHLGGRGRIRHQNVQQPAAQRAEDGLQILERHLPRTVAH